MMVGTMIVGICWVGLRISCVFGYFEFEEKSLTISFWACSSEFCEFDLTREFCVTYGLLWSRGVTILIWLMEGFEVSLDALLKQQPIKLKIEFSTVP